MAFTVLIIIPTGMAIIRNGALRMMMIFTDTITDGTISETRSMI